jgi:hypothetical protein
MMVSVNVGFLKMPVLKPVGVLCMDINTQRKDIVNIQHITTYNKIVHTTIPASTPYFRIKPKKTTRPRT